MEENEKKIDENWKERIEQEKETFQANTKEKNLEPDFKLFLSSLGLQAMVALGELENPVTKKKEEDIAQAKYLIDILGIIKEKTNNNLDNEENEILENLLYQLRTVYIAKVR